MEIKGNCSSKLKGNHDDNVRRLKNYLQLYSCNLGVNGLLNWFRERQDKNHTNNTNSWGEDSNYDAEETYCFIGVHTSFTG